MTLAELRVALRSLESGETPVPPEEVPNVAGLLASVQATIVLRAARVSAPMSVAPPRTEEPQGGRFLTTAEAARLIGRSRWWLWKHASQIPAVILPGGRRAYSSARLQRWRRERELK